MSLHDPTGWSAAVPKPRDPPASAAAFDDRARFRLASRRVLQAPGDPALHCQRARYACALPGAEPLQAALVDMLVGCDPDPARFAGLLHDTQAATRLPRFVIDTLQSQVETGRRLPSVHRLATRWCVLASPSLDVPERARLCNADDSRSIATAALPALMANDEEAERQFLAHCVGARDTLAFFMAWRDLQRVRKSLSARWDEVADLLQHESHQ